MGWGALESLRGRPSQLDAIEAVHSGGWAEVEEACGVGFYVGRRGQCFIVGQGSGGAGWRVVQRATSPESASCAAHIAHSLCPVGGVGEGPRVPFLPPDVAVL